MWTYSTYRGQETPLDGVSWRGRNAADDKKKMSAGFAGKNEQWGQEGMPSTTRKNDCGICR